MSSIRFGSNQIEPEFISEDGWPIPYTLENGDALVIGPDDHYPRIQGQAYMDLDDNGVFNGADRPIVNKLLRTTSDNWSALTRSGGHYSLPVDIGTAYTFKMFPTHLPYFVLTPSEYALATPAMPDTIYQPYDFRWIKTGVNPDLEVSLECGRMRPGFQTESFIQVRNVGTEIVNGTLSFLPGYPLQFLSSEPAPNSIDLENNTYSYEFKDLDLGEVIRIPVLLSIHSNTPLATKVTSELRGEITGQADVAPLNNVQFCTEFVRGAYDPNDKQVSHRYFTPADMSDEDFFLEYKIRFQNTGTDTAQRVYIDDVLSEQLDLNSLELISSSHDCQIQIRRSPDDPAKSILRWTFPGILLPDSTANLAASQGFVKFRIRPVQTLQLGEDILNRAAIYFDFNEPVITEDAISSYVFEVATEEIPGLEIGLSPNPVVDRLKLETSLATGTPAELQILDSKGQIVLKKSMQLGEDIRVSELAPGLYQVYLHTRSGSGWARFVKAQ